MRQFIRLGGSLALFFILLTLVACNNNSGGREEEELPGAGFFEGFDDNKIDENVWRIATWEEHGGKTGRERCYVEDGVLHLVFVNDSQKKFLSAAIETKQEFLYGRWEARMKISALPRICNAMYTIDWNDSTVEGFGDGTKQEIDIEFLTRTFSERKGTVHYAVHEESAESFGKNPDLDFNPAADFHVWGFEITPTQIRWFLDGKELESYVYSENPIKIDADYNLKFNTWSGGNWVTGEEGDPPQDKPGHFLIDWVKFTAYAAD